MPGQGYIHELFPLLEGLNWEQITDFDGYPMLAAGASKEILHFEKARSSSINGWINMAHISCNNPFLLIKLESDKNVVWFSPFLVESDNHNIIIRTVKYDVPNSIYVLESVPEAVPYAYGEKLIISVVNPLTTPIIVWDLLFCVLSIVNKKQLIESLQKLIGNQPKIEALLQQIAGK